MAGVEEEGTHTHQQKTAFHCQHGSHAVREKGQTSLRQRWGRVYWIQGKAKTVPQPRISVEQEKKWAWRQKTATPSFKSAELLWALLGLHEWSWYVHHSFGTAHHNQRHFGERANTTAATHSGLALAFGRHAVTVASKAGISLEAVA